MGIDADGCVEPDGETDVDGVAEYGMAPGMEVDAFGVDEFIELPDVPLTELSGTSVSVTFIVGVILTLSCALTQAWC